MTISDQMEKLEPMIDKETDTRNVIDEFKGVERSDIIAKLDSQDRGLVISLENIEREFSAVTIVRSANAFGVRHVYIIGRRQWNKRGAMVTDKYLHVHHFAKLSEFIKEMKVQGRQVIAVDNVAGSKFISEVKLPKDAVLVFGHEGSGISEELMRQADMIVAIEQYGSTRSINVGSAATVAMYCWLQQHVL